LGCANNQLTTLDVAPLVNLTTLACSFNQLTVLDVSNLVNLESLYCQHNMIEVLDFSKLTKLAYISCYVNQLKTLDASALAEVKTISASQNQLLDIVGLNYGGNYVQNSYQRPTIEVVPDLQTPGSYVSLHSYYVDPSHTLVPDNNYYVHYEAEDGRFYLNGAEALEGTWSFTTMFPNAERIFGDIDFVLVTPTGAPGSGDFDGDGRVTMTEVITTLNVVIGRGIFTPEQKASVDMDGDGAVTMTDVIKVLRRTVGLDRPS
jgi:hypothetical protein